MLPALPAKRQQVGATCDYGLPGLAKSSAICEMLVKQIRHCALAPSRNNPLGRCIMANPFVHVELNTADLGRAKDFYGSLFDWQLDDATTSKYRRGIPIQ